MLMIEINSVCASEDKMKFITLTRPVSLFQLNHSYSNNNKNVIAGRTRENLIFLLFHLLQCGFQTRWVWNVYHAAWCSNIHLKSVIKWIAEEASVKLFHAYQILIKTRPLDNEFMMLVWIEMLKRKVTNRLFVVRFHVMSVSVCVKFKLPK